MQIVEFEWPCGLKQKVKSLSLLGLIFSYVEVGERYSSGCPIHGHKCSKGVK